jgi:putative endopeptidase
MATRLTALICGCLLIPACATALAPSSHAAFGTFGIDLTAQDKAVKPGDDFYQYANGHWVSSHTIPSDRVRWGSFDQLAESAEDRVQKLIEGLPANAPAGSIEQKVGDYYRAFMNEAAIEAAGIQPARPALEAIAAARDYKDVAALMGRPDLSLASPIDVAIGTDEKNPDRYLADLRQGGLALPDRDYYLNSDAKFKQIRDEYQAHIEKMLRLAGESNAATQAREIVALEAKIAGYHWPRAKRRERELTYNLRTLTQVEQQSPAFPWSEFLAPLGLADRK